MNYKECRLPKKHGGYRVIHVPDTALMDELHDILNELMHSGIGPGPHLHAYVRGRNIITNAKALMAWDPIDKKYLTPKYLLKADIFNFFNKFRII